jgi:endonuclease/exonuclease/phosphatase family metal-dependent hydrolase
VPEVVVASFNTHAGIDGWGRSFDVAEACRQLDADVIVTQEVWWGDEEPDPFEPLRNDGYTPVELRLARGQILSPDPHARLSWGPRPRRTGRRAIRLDGDRDGGRSVPPPGRSFSRGSWGLAVLSRLPARHVETVDLGQLKRDPAPRAAVLVSVEVDGSTLLIAGTHLSHLTHGSPRQLARLRRSLPGTGPGVVAGDMNFWGPPLSALLPGWRRAVRGRSWPSSWPHSQLDHIFVTREVSVMGGEVLTLGGSDHLPVRARLDVGRDRY